MAVMLGWGEEEGGMEVDNQSPPDCQARWVCNECQMEAPKVWPYLYLVCLVFAPTQALITGIPRHCEWEDCLCDCKAGGGWPHTWGLWEVLENLWQGKTWFEEKFWGQLFNFPFSTGAPPQPCSHARHQVLLPEYLGPQRRVGKKIEIKITWYVLNFRCTMSQMTDAQLQTKENLARNFLEIARKILPGISRLKVGLLGWNHRESRFFLPREQLYMSCIWVSSNVHCGRSMTQEPGEVLGRGMCSVCSQWQGSTYRC